MVTARQATEADLDEIMLVEQDWEESQRAGRARMTTRLRKFGEGFLIFERDGAVIGTLMSFPMRYDPAEVGELSTWDAVTNNGDYPPVDLATANALYLASGSLKRSERGSTAYEAMMEEAAALAERLGLSYVLAGAKIPGYDSYCRRFGEIDAREYAFTWLNGCLVDPFLEMYRGHGYVVPDKDHIVPNYYPDPPSRDYGAIVVRSLGTR
ncbi:hypothetical protein [Allokutzneria albata]|uniref:N-acetyltransferase domain-containing protein n=1 Tax=Allokutzneria albata TaxID=211114 RepID=A0A1G9S0Q6_ALLAB|nr:hypothetical protein [Allokutzneria albata]SDM29128.1 hypothetical protein SAMN04489726_0820 [Allokutzneria albata]